MIRKDREITDLGEQLAILRDCDACRIALNDPETGFPYVVPLNFGLDIEGDQVYLYFHSARRGTLYPPWPTEMRVYSAPRAFPISRHSSKYSMLSSHWARPPAI